MEELVNLIVKIINENKGKESFLKANAIDPVTVITIIEKLLPSIMALINAIISAFGQAKAAKVI